MLVDPTIRGMLIHKQDAILGARPEQTLTDSSLANFMVVCIALSQWLDMALGPKITARAVGLFSVAVHVRSRLDIMQVNAGRHLRLQSLHSGPLRTKMT